MNSRIRTRIRTALRPRPLLMRLQDDSKLRTRSSLLAACKGSSSSCGTYRSIVLSMMGSVPYTDAANRQEAENTTELYLENPAQDGSMPYKSPSGLSASTSQLDENIHNFDEAYVLFFSASGHPNTNALMRYFDVQAPIRYHQRTPARIWNHAWNRLPFPQHAPHPEAPPVRHGLHRIVGWSFHARCWRHIPLRRPARPAAHFLPAIRPARRRSGDPRQSRSPSSAAAARPGGYTADAGLSN